MTRRPTGTVTFLFTDVEGSTRLWEAHPRAMKDAVANHERILRAAIEAHDGYAFAETGDGLGAAFEDPLQAALAAVEAQQLLTPSRRSTSMTVVPRIDRGFGQAGTESPYEITLFVPESAAVGGYTFGLDLPTGASGRIDFEHTT